MQNVFLILVSLTFRASSYTTFHKDCGRGKTACVETVVGDKIILVSLTFRASSYTTFHKDCGRGMAACVETVVGDKQGHRSCKILLFQ